MGAKILIIDHNDSFTYNLVGLFERAGALVSQVDVWSVGELAGKDLQLVGDYDGLVLSPGPGLPGDYTEVTRLLDVVLKGGHLSNLPILGICLGLQTLITYFGGTLHNLTHIQHGRQVELQLQPEQVAELGPKVVCSLFAGLQVPIKVGLYHSWAMVMDVDRENTVSQANPLESVQDVELDASKSMEPHGVGLSPSVLTELEVLATTNLSVDVSGSKIGVSSAKEGREVARKIFSRVAETAVVMGVRHKHLPILGLQFHPESYMTPDGLKMICNWLRIIKNKCEL